MAHWHDDNPWAAGAVYLKVEDLATAVTDGSAEEVRRVLAHWRTYGDKLDAYALPRPDGLFSVGVRFGPEPEQYLSPWGRDVDLLRRLVAGRTPGIDDVSDDASLIAQGP